MAIYSNTCSSFILKGKKQTVTITVLSILYRPIWALFNNQANDPYSSIFTIKDITALPVKLISNQSIYYLIRDLESQFKSVAKTLCQIKQACKQLGEQYV